MPFASTALVGAVHDDPAEPGAKLRVPAEAGETLEPPQPGLLQDVLGARLVVSGEAVREPVEHGRVAPVQLAESLLVAVIDDTADQGPI